MEEGVGIEVLKASGLAEAQELLVKVGERVEKEQGSKARVRWWQIRDKLGFPACAVAPSPLLPLPPMSLLIPARLLPCPLSSSTGRCKYMSMA